MNRKIKRLIAEIEDNKFLKFVSMLDIPVQQIRYMYLFENNEDIIEITYYPYSAYTLDLIKTIISNSYEFNEENKQLLLNSLNDIFDIFSHNLDWSFVAKIKLNENNFEITEQSDNIFLNKQTIIADYIQDVLIKYCRENNIDKRGNTISCLSWKFSKVLCKKINESIKEEFNSFINKFEVDFNNFING